MLTIISRYRGSHQRAVGSLLSFRRVLQVGDNWLNYPLLLQPPSLFYALAIVFRQLSSVNTGRPLQPKPLLLLSLFHRLRPVTACIHVYLSWWIVKIRYSRQIKHGSAVDYPILLKFGMWVYMAYGLLEPRGLDHQNRVTRNRNEMSMAALICDSSVY